MKIQDSKIREVPIAPTDAKESPDLGALFDGHIAREFADFDVDATMKPWWPSLMCTASLP